MPDTVNKAFDSLPDLESLPNQGGVSTPLNSGNTTFDSLPDAEPAASPTSSDTKVASGNDAFDSLPDLPDAPAATTPSKAVSGSAAFDSLPDATETTAQEAKPQLPVADTDTELAALRTGAEAIRAELPSVAKAKAAREELLPPPTSFGLLAATKSAKEFDPEKFKEAAAQLSASKKAQKRIHKEIDKPFVDKIWNKADAEIDKLPKPSGLPSSTVPGVTGPTSSRSIKAHDDYFADVDTINLRALIREGQTYLATDTEAPVTYANRKLWRNKEFIDKLPFSPGFMIRLIAVNDLSQRKQEGETLSEKDELFLQQWATDESVKKTVGETSGNKIFSGIVDALPYMAEFGITSGMATGIRKAVRAVIPGVLGKVTAATAVAFARAAVTPKTYADAVQRKMPSALLAEIGGDEILFEDSSETWFSATGKALLNAAIENVSEESGDVIFKMLKKIGGKGAEKMFRATTLTALSEMGGFKGKGALAATIKLMKKMGKTGIVGEYTEERYGAALRELGRLAGVDLESAEGRNLFQRLTHKNMREFGEELGVLAGLPVAVGGPALAANVANQIQQSKAQRKRERALVQEIGEPGVARGEERIAAEEQAAAAPVAAPAEAEPEAAPVEAAETPQEAPEAVPTQEPAPEADVDVGDGEPVSVTPGVEPAPEESIVAGQDIEAAPTEAQKEAGNYPKGHVNLDGYDITIENAIGSSRSGTDAQGNPWTQEMNADYGYIKGTVGFDKDHLDTFIKPEHKGGSDTVFVVNQVDPNTGAFDEHKVIFGADNQADAEAIYLSNYQAGWQGMSSVVAMRQDQFKQWAFNKGKNGPKGGALTLDQASKITRTNAQIAAAALAKVEAARVAKAAAAKAESTPSPKPTPKATPSKQIAKKEVSAPDSKPVAEGGAKGAAISKPAKKKQAKKPRRKLPGTPIKSTISVAEQKRLDAIVAKDAKLARKLERRRKGKTPAQVAAQKRAAAKLQAVEADQPRAEFRRSWLKKVRRPAKDDPLRKEILKAIPERFLRNNPDLLTVDQILKEARSQGIVPDEIEDKSAALRYLFSDPLRRVREDAAEEAAQVSSQVSEAAHNEFVADIDVGIRPAQDRIDQFPEEFALALAEVGVTEDSLEIRGEDIVDDISFEDLAAEDEAAAVAAAERPQLTVEQARADLDRGKEVQQDIFGEGAVGDVFNLSAQEGTDPDRIRRDAEQVAKEEADFERDQGSLFSLTKTQEKKDATGKRPQQERERHSANRQRGREKFDEIRQSIVNDAGQGKTIQEAFARAEFDDEYAESEEAIAYADKLTKQGYDVVFVKKIDPVGGFTMFDPGDKLVVIATDEESKSRPKWAIAEIQEHEFFHVLETNGDVAAREAANAIDRNSAEFKEYHRVVLGYNPRQARDASASDIAADLYAGRREKHGVDLTAAVREGSERAAGLFSINEGEPAPNQGIYSFNEAIRTSASFMGEWLKTNKAATLGSKTDLDPFIDILLGTPSFYTEKIGGYKRAYDAGLSLSDIRSEIENEVYDEKDPVTGDIVHLPEIMHRFERADKQEYRRVSDELDRIDRFRDYRRIDKNEDGAWQLFDKNGDAMQGHVYPQEQDALNAMFDMEAEEWRDNGYSPAAVEFVRAIRVINAKTYDRLREDVNETLDMLKKSGEKAPTLDLRAALKKMGDLRGGYMPRRHPSGQWWAMATKEGQQPRRLVSDLKSKITAQAVALRHKGWEVTTPKKSNEPSEDAFAAAAGIAGVENIVNASLARMRAETPTLQDYNLSGEVVTRNGKPVLIIESDRARKTVVEVLKDFGGRWFQDTKAGETKKMWHFSKPGKDLDTQIARAIQQATGIQGDIVSLFAQILSTKLADVIKGRGSLSVKIARNDKVGEDVVAGYEKDASRRVIQSVKSMAGGQSKRIVGQQMLRAITGTDITWQEFKSANVDAEIQEGTEAYRDQMKGLYKAYRDLVQSRRIDSGQQPVAFKDAMSLYREIMRNQTRAERIIGMLRGFAAIKYLSRISTGIVNLTALVTSVPAAMRQEGIQFNTSTRYLARASTRYGRYLLNKHLNKGAGVSAEDKAMFEYIQERGWHTPQFTKAATDILRGRTGSAFRKFTNLMMLGMSKTEELNRMATIAGSYMAMRDQANAAGQPFDIDETMQRAKHISDRGHGVYEKANLPAAARGTGFGSQIVKSWYMFKTYPHNFLQLMVRDMGIPGAKKLFTERGTAKFSPEAQGFIWMAVTPMILAGLGAGPLSFIIKGIVRAVTGSPDDPEEKAIQWVEENYGTVAATFVRKGVMSAGGFGPDISGSLRIDLFEPPRVDRDAGWWGIAKGLGGAPASVVDDLLVGGTSLLDGDFLKGVEMLLPSGLSAPIKGYREATQGLTRRDNSPVFYGKDPLRATWWDASLRVFGFNPSRLSSIRNRQWKEFEARKTYRDLREEISAQIRRRIAHGEDIIISDDIRAAIADYNELADVSIFQPMTQISDRWVNNLVKRTTTAPKLERDRFS